MADSELHVDGLRQRDIHLRRNQRHLEFGVGRLDIALAFGVEREVVALQVIGGEAADRIREHDRAVLARIAVVLERLAARFEAEGRSDIAGPEGEQVGPRELEVPRGDGRVVAAVDGNRDRLDRGDLAGRTVAAGEVVDAAAVERVVGVRRGAGERLLEQRVGDAVFLVLRRGHRIEQRRFPVPAFPVAAQAGEDARGQVFDFRLAWTRIDGAIGRRIGQRAQHEIERGARVAGKAVGRANHAKRVVVVRRRHDDRHGAEHRGRFTVADAVGEIDATLGEQLQPAVELVVQEDEGVVAVYAVGDRGVGVDVVAQVLIARDRVINADAVAELREATGQRVGLDVELAGGVGHRRTVDQDIAYREAVENTPGRRDRRVVEAGGRRIRRPVRRQARAQVGVRGEVAVAGEDRVACEIGGENGHIGAAIGRGDPELHRRRELVGVGAVLVAVGQVEGEAFEIVLEDSVDHASHGVRAVDGRGAVEQDFDPAHAHGGDRVGVDGDDRHQVLGLGARVVHHAAAVEQDQRVAGAQRAQVDRGGIAAGVVEAADGAGGVEGDIAQLRDGPEQIVARHGGDGVQLLLAHHGDRQGLGRLGADDL